MDECSQSENQNLLRNILEKNSDTTLMAWLELNKTDEFARTLLYSDLPKHYTFLKRSRKWKRRKTPNENVAGRMYNVHSKDSERFALRLILNHIRGPTSFEQIKTVNNVLHSSFYAAAIERNLIQNSEEAINCLEEAYLLINGAHKFREFFAQFLINCSPEATNLWERFKLRLSEDIYFQIKTASNNDHLEHSEDIILLGLIEIKKIVELEGSSLDAIPGLPQLTTERIESLLSMFNYNMLTTNVQGSTIEEARKILENNLTKLNTEQKNCFDSIIHENNEGITK